MFKLPSIDFSKAPFLSPETVEFHYGKHHKAYVDNLNKLLEGKGEGDLLKIIKSSEGPLFNNSAQTFNHTFYWLCLTPAPAALSSGSALAKAIQADFGSVEELEKKFAASAMAVFGSGWTWLVADRASKKLSLVNTSNAAVPDFDKQMPVLLCDVWEHAYYIDHRNARAGYLQKFWPAVNWSFAEACFEKQDLAPVLATMK